MKAAMQKEYGIERGKIIAAKTWNSRMKGTGKTVGNGRN
jgi:hypothetical protein